MPLINNRLNHLVRKNKGKVKLGDYKKSFTDFNISDLEYIHLEQADIIIEKVKETFPQIELESEMIDGNSVVSDSKLLSGVIDGLNKNDTCYIYVDDYDRCGMFKANAISAFHKCFAISKATYENTCFLVDCRFNYSFTINYTDVNDRYYKDKIEIHKKVVVE